MSDERPKASFGAAQGRQRLGLRNCGEEILHCADCGTALMRFLITRTNQDLARLGLEPVTTTVKAKCEICGGESYVKQIEGAFAPGAFADDIAFDIAESGKPDTTVFRVWRKGP